jgi:hypothetical protein
MLEARAALQQYIREGVYDREQQTEVVRRLMEATADYCCAETAERRQIIPDEPLSTGSGRVSNSRRPHADVGLELRQSWVITAEH